MTPGPGERILWQGQPVQGLRFAPVDIFAVPFTAVWLGIVVVAFSAAVQEPEARSNPMLFFMIPLFVGVGLHMLVGRFVVDIFARRRTRYFLTNQRAVIESGLFRSSVSSVSLATAPEIRLQGGRSGRGTVHFGSSGLFGMMPPNWPGISQHLPPAFHDIEDAEQIYGRALTAQREALGRG